ncbi:MAG: FG-GAP-like repeat-containing protein, partial [Nitrospira sp.]|nr:FG-GAP-like repeat-containing protein [Nitrospira sp.]
NDMAVELAKEIVASGADTKTTSLLAAEVFEDLLMEKDIKKRLNKIDEFMKTFSMSREQVYMENAIRLNIVSKELHDNDLLIKYGEEWINKEPDNRRANFIVGSAYIDADIALERAVEYIQKALTMINNPDLADKPEYYPESEWYKDLNRSEGIYYDTLGWAYYKLGKYKNAERAYNMALKYNDFNSNLHYHIGLLREGQGKTEDALYSYITSLKSGENKDAAEKAHNISETYYSIKEPLYRSFADMEGLTTFTDVTEQAGLQGISAQRVSWGDYNNDGYEDLLFNGYLLYRNNGDGTFTNVTQEAGISYVSGANGGVWGDFDNDGNLDFYTFASGDGSTDRFWRNNGDGTFTDITQKAVERPDIYPTEAAAWGDYDNDGFIDLYVANYEKPLFKAIDRARGTPDRLFHNNGDNTFSDVSTYAGISPMENMCGRGVSWGDYNNDGYQDIYVSNYRLDPNFLWRNNGNGSFTNVAEESGVEGYEQEGMYGHSIGAEWGDFNNDGNLDLFVTNLAHPRYIGISDKSMLLENQGPPDFKFKDIFGSSGIRFEETNADPSMADYDNDGKLDLFFTSTYEGRKSFLYKGNGDGTFSDVTWLAGVRLDNGWGNAYADYDKDGQMDLIVAGSNGVRLFRNNGNGNHWLQVKVVGKRSNRSGIGARVTVMRSAKCEVQNTKCENLKQIREVQGGKGSGSQHSMIAAFGLGGYNGTVDVEVKFPSGMIVKQADVKVNQMILVNEE